MRYLALIFFALQVGLHAAVTSISGTVISVYDGDTLKVRDANGTVHDIRFGHIDAPEMSKPKQAYGIIARDALRALVLNKDVVVRELGNGGWGRTYGMELLLRHEITRNFFGWIAYTLSLSERDLNQDEERLLPTPFDQRHILTVVGQTKLPWNFTLGVRLRVVTGTRDNAPIGSTHDLDTSRKS